MTPFLLRQEMFEVDLYIIISTLDGMNSTEHNILKCLEEAPTVILITFFSF